MLPWTAAQVLMCPDGTFRTHTSLRPNLNQAYKSQSDYYQIEIEFLIFGQRKQNSPGLMQFATHKTATPPLAGELIAQQTIICRATRKIVARILTQHQQK